MRISFWGELSRRIVVKVGIAYLAVAWLIAQVVGLVMPIFNAPEWIAQVVIVVLILGFPIILLNTGSSSDASSLHKPALGLAADR